ncbi:hypothetical protein CDD82_4584 [Ophiocordyceps australis]|uniref:Inner kinetochore subunit AME1 domain-containing protein n=1 Tax=Ophiocordyceps australis TaxID=1399860 RepID=A0A2C5ZU32_9HYPO|nr:hypothetical protein CDD82_4584 [Ophiocordyceps australis]
MATAGQERRAERLNQRLRGAQRVDVADESFNLNIAGLNSTPAEPPKNGHTPSSVARKRKRHGTESDKTEPETTGPQTTGSTSRRFARLAIDDAHHSPTSRESMENSRLNRSDKEQMVDQNPPSSRAKSSVVRKSSDKEQRGEAVQVRETASLRSPAISPPPLPMMEEVAESPAYAPGSGRRRSVRYTGASSSVARLQLTMSTEEAGPSSSSPLVRMARRNDAESAMRSRRSPLSASLQLVDEVDELLSNTGLEGAVANSSLNVPANGDLKLEADEAAQSGEEAEEIDAVEAAQVLGKKARRKSVRTSSPQLGSGNLDEDRTQAEPAPKRRRNRVAKSPAQQKAPTRKRKPSKTQVQDEQTRAPKPTARQHKEKTATQRETDEEAADANDDPAVEITVQRYVNFKRRAGDDDTDPLHLHLPFANRNAETAVDVLAQVCREVVTTTMEQFEQLLRSADDTAQKKECRIKMRAVEAFGQELSSRLLQHAIHLDHWHSLRKQLRQTQRERAKLRDEILRLRGERDQVALRMDAVRIKHQADDMEATYRINASTLMNDIELAVEQGKQAPEPSPAAQKRARVANLELLIARVSEQASSASASGGLLRQVQDFNKLLERAALQLESR